MGTVASAQLRVYQAPRIVAALQTQVIHRTGDRNFQVSCTAVAKPRPSVTWLKDGIPLDPSSPEDRGFYKIETQDVDIKKGAYTVNSTLYFSGVNRKENAIMAQDRGYYTCVLENEVKKEESHMYLRVQHKPIFQREVEMEIMDRAAFDIGDTAYIPCRVQAFPKPEFEWSFNSLMLNIDAKHARPYEHNLTILANDVYVSTLIVPGVHADDYGEYKCRASNSMGNATNVIMLQERGRPSPPVIVKVVDTEISSVLVEWIPGFTGGYEDTSYVVNYMANDGISRDFDCQNYNPCNITGLEQQTSYVFRVSFLIILCISVLLIAVGGLTNFS